MTKILIAPGPFHEFRKNLEESASAYDIRCLGQEEGDVRFCFEEDSFLDALERLPAGWEPDVVLWVCQYSPIPRGIENSPYPTVAAVGDWNVLFSGLKENLKRFDWIVVDKRGVEVFRRAGYENVDFWPLFSFQPHLHRRLEQTERDIDVLMIGNFNHSLQRERAGWLRRIARMSHRWNVQLLTGIYGEEYARTMNRARICFNRSIRGEMNMRAYEAPACGALLFYEEENLEVRHFLEDRKECVLYNSRNLEELIDYYLSHEEERVKIAEAGWQRVQAESQGRHLDRLAELLKERGVLEKKKRHRPFNDLPLGFQLYHQGIQAFEQTNVSKATMAAAEHTFRSMETLVPDNPGMKNALGVLYGFYAGLMNDPQEKQTLDEQAVQAFLEALEKAPSSGLLRHNLAQLCLGAGRADLAEEQFRQAVEILKQQDSISCEDLFFPRAFDSFFVEWQKIGADFVDDPAKESDAYRNLLLWRCCECLGDLAAGKERYEEAADWYREAIRAYPALAGELRRKLGDVLQGSGRVEEALGEYRQGYDEAPFDTMLWKRFVELCYRTGHHSECVELCEDLLAIIEACPSYEEHRSWFLSKLEEAKSR